MITLDWSEDQVLAHAPDPASAKAGKDLGNTRKWVTLAANDSAVWGECQGSGKNPYQAQIDINNLAFKCSCPSRKFPCKHGIGLLLIYTRQQNQFKEEENAPQWVTDWISKRAEKQEKKAEKIEKEANDPSKAKAKAKTQEKRNQKVADGVEDLSGRMRDWIRTGLLQMPQQSYGWWEEIAARMVDYQAPGLANNIRAMGEIEYFQEGWQPKLLRQIGQTWLLLEAYQNQENLAADFQDEIKAWMGITLKQEELKAEHPAVQDTWMVLGREYEIDEKQKLHIEKLWLSGLGTKRIALILNFGFRGQFPMDMVRLTPGVAFEGELVFYPGIMPLRALVKSKKKESPIPQLLGFPTLSEAYNFRTEYRARTPWGDRIPLLLENISISPLENNWILLDKENKTLKINPLWKGGWKYLAFTGGNPSTVFGVWNNEEFLPLYAWQNGKGVLFELKVER